VEAAQGLLLDCGDPQGHPGGSGHGDIAHESRQRGLAGLTVELAALHQNRLEDLAIEVKGLDCQSGQFDD